MLLPYSSAWYGSHLRDLSKSISNTHFRIYVKPVYNILEGYGTINPNQQLPDFDESVKIFSFHKFPENVTLVRIVRNLQKELYR